MSYLSEHLRKLGTGEVLPVYEDLGICRELDDLANEGKITHAEYFHIQILMQSWPEFSGNREFPVSHPTLSPSAGFCYFRNLWADDEYGNARRRLCLWLADQLEIED